VKEQNRKKGIDGSELVYENLFPHFHFDTNKKKESKKSLTTTLPTTQFKKQKQINIMYKGEKKIRPWPSPWRTTKSPHPLLLVQKSISTLWNTCEHYVVTMTMFHFIFTCEGAK